MTDTAGATLTRVRRRALVKPLIRRVETLRILFGLVWAIDAYLKWQPSFITSYAQDVRSAAQGQPDWLRPWFRLWRHVAAADPRLLAYVTAVVETMIAAALLLGFARRAAYIGGAAWSLAIWVIPEGFGGSFLAGATDIGTAIMYVFVFAALYSLETLPAATGAWTLDRRIERRIKWWYKIAEPGGMSRSKRDPMRLQLKAEPARPATTSRCGRVWARYY
jgi:nitrite reductase (NO-forming)